VSPGTQPLRGQGRFSAASAGTSLEAPRRVRVTAALLLVLATTLARAENTLPSPLRVGDVVRLARGHRAEIVAANAKARAAAQRPAIASALDDPSVSISIDHLPFSSISGLFSERMFDRSAAVEQAFPLSRVRGHRKRAAQAEARRELAESARVALDVELEAVAAFWMLQETRARALIADRQHAIARQLVSAALSRYSSNTGPQADVLRAQTEAARLDAERRAVAAEVRAAEVMLNTNLARDADAAIPDLDPTVPEIEPPAPAAIASAASRRPELRAGRAEIESAEAEVRVMRSMYAPMAMVRTGPAYTMAEGWGWMVMIGVSIPLWRGKLGASVDESRAMVDMANADLEAMRRMVDGQARVAREVVAAARVRYLALRDDVVPRAEQAIAPTLAAYAAGQVPLVSVVEAAQALWSSERELAMSRAELGIAWARLRRTTGEETPR
jgi:outer membrane protein, heavy metal efflux system